MPKTAALRAAVFKQFTKKPHGGVQTPSQRGAGYLTAAKPATKEKEKEKEQKQKNQQTNKQTVEKHTHKNNNKTTTTEYIAYGIYRHGMDRSFD